MCPLSAIARPRYDSTVVVSSVEKAPALLIWKGARTVGGGRGRPSLYSQRSTISTEDVRFTTQESAKMDTAVMVGDLLPSLPTLPSGGKGVLVLDGYASHKTPETVERARRLGWVPFIVPPNRTSYLNMCDQNTVNRKFKGKLREEYTSWAGPRLVNLRDDETLAVPDRSTLQDWVASAAGSLTQEDLQTAFSKSLWPGMKATNIVTPVIEEEVAALPEPASLDLDVPDLDESDLEIVSDIEPPSERRAQWGFARVVMAPKKEKRQVRGQTVWEAIPGEFEKVVMFSKNLV